MIVDIKNFALTGDFGTVKVGMTEQQVRDRHGTPDSEEENKRNGNIFLYAWYELFFHPKGTLHAIQIDHYDATDPSSFQFKNDKFEIRPWLMTSPKCPCFQDIKKTLDAEQVAHTVIEYWGRQAIKLESGVKIDFSDQPEKLDDRRLIGFRYFPPEYFV